MRRQGRVRVDLQLPGWVTGRETGLPWQRVGCGGRGVWVVVGPEAGIWKPELRADTQSWVEPAELGRRSTGRVGTLPFSGRTALRP